jgi:hypothetical protein
MAIAARTLHISKRNAASRGFTHKSKSTTVPQLIVSKKLDAPYKSGPSKAWLKTKNPKPLGPLMERFKSILLLGGLWDDLDPEVRGITIGLLVMIWISVVILVANLVS